MATRANGAQTGDATGKRRDDSVSEPLTTRADDQTPAQFDVLDDRHTQEILTTLSDGPKRGRELTETCTASRTTIYRRINSLEAIGLVNAETTLDPDGHHCKKFRLVRDKLVVTIENGIITVTVQSALE